MAGISQRDRQPIAGINVTPLVDIALVLLIIFMVTAKIVVTAAVPLDLPRAGKTEDVQVILSVIVPKRGAMLVNGTATPDEQRFAAAVEEVLAEHPEVRAVIHAEASTSHAQVLGVLDRLRTLGVNKVAFAADPIEQGGS
jgi:biopolymer transport protein ExbD